MANGSTGGPVAPMDYDMVRRIFKQPKRAQYHEFGRPDRVCVECECLGHICRPCRARRFNARERLREPVAPSLWAEFLAMFHDYPIAVPLTCVIFFALGVLAVAVPSIVIARL